MISFQSVPRASYESACDLFGASQQMALALLITDIEAANIAVLRYNKGGASLTAKELLQWAEQIRSEMKKEEWLKALLSPTLPELNSHPGYFTGVLERTTAPDWEQIAMFSLLEEICDDSTKGKIELFASNKEAIVREMIKRGIRNPVIPGSKWNLSEKICKDFLELQKVKEYILEWKSIQHLKLQVKNNDKKFYLVRNLEDGVSTLVRARSLTEAEQVMTNGRAVEIDFDYWIQLGGD